MELEIVEEIAAEVVIGVSAASEAVEIKNIFPSVYSSDRRL